MSFLNLSLHAFLKKIFKNENTQVQFISHPQWFFNDFDAVELLKKLHTDVNLDKILLITTDTLVDTKEFQAIKNKLIKYKYEFTQYVLAPNTMLDRAQIIDLSNVFLSNKCTCIFTYGNNYVTSCAKYCRHYINNKQVLNKRFTFDKMLKNKINLVCIASTFNIEFAINQISFFYNQANKKIYYLANNQDPSTVLFIDKSLIPIQSNTVKLDLFSLLIELIEIYLSSRTNNKNSHFAYAAMKTIWEAYCSGKITDDTINGLLFKSYAFNSNWIGYAYALSLAISLITKTDYKTVLCWVYPFVFEYLLNINDEIRQLFCDAVDIFNFEYLSLDNMSKSYEHLASLAKISQKLVDVVGLRKMLNGISESDINTIINITQQNIFANGSIVKFGKKDIKKILHNILQNKLNI